MLFDFVIKFEMMFLLELYIRIAALVFEMAVKFVNVLLKARSIISSAMANLEIVVKLEKVFPYERVPTCNPPKEPFVSAVKLEKELLELTTIVIPEPVFEVAVKLEIVLLEAS